jgi:hypothetical protein
MTRQLVVALRGIVSPGFPDQLHFHRANLGVGDRFGFPQDLFPQDQLEPIRVKFEVRDDLRVGAGAPML